MDLAALSVHNGVASHEVRLILAMDRNTRYPLYFRCVKGNVPDVNSLAITIADMGASPRTPEVLRFETDEYSTNGLACWNGWVY